MAKEKKEKDMSPEKVEEQLKAVELFKVQELKPKQTVLDLDTLSDVDVQINYKVYSVLPGADENLVLAELQKMVSPASAQIDALIDYVNRIQQYREAKKSALAAGNYLTSQLSSTAVMLMQQTPQFADIKAADCRDRFVKGVKEKKPGALKFLERAKAIVDAADEPADF